MTGLFFAHSGLRYLVLLAGVLALAYYGYSIATRRPVDRPARILGAAFNGLLDLQIVLGLVLMVAGIFYGALMGHLTLMLLAALVAHGTSAFARRTPDARRSYTIRFFGVFVALGLIVMGVMAIGRDLFGTGRPTGLG